tara:strand:+ start:2218 stop:2565 length:348 start_codon:yes stop_codon:yes gene_type:complete
MTEKTYSGRVSSKGTGAFFSPNQTFNGISALPTPLTEALQPLFIGTADPHGFVKSYPKMMVKLNADGTVGNIETDVKFVTPTGEIVNASDIQFLAPTPKPEQSVDSETEQDTELV